MAIQKVVRALLHNGHVNFTEARGSALTFVDPTVASTRAPCNFETAAGLPTVFSKRPEFALIVDENGRILPDPPKSSMSPQSVRERPDFLLNFVFSAF